MNFDSIENLNEEIINELYFDIIEKNTEKDLLSWNTTAWLCQTQCYCSDSRIIRTAYGYHPTDATGSKQNISNGGSWQCSPRFAGIYGVSGQCGTNCNVYENVIRCTKN